MEKKLKKFHSEVELTEEKERVLNNFFKYTNDLEQQAIMRGFGKMVNARNVTNPKYSFGKEKRFFNIERDNNLLTFKEEEKNHFLTHNKFSNLSMSNNFNNKSDFKKNLKYSMNSSSLPRLNFITSGEKTTDFLYRPISPKVYKFDNSPKWHFSKAKRNDILNLKERYRFYDNKYDPNTDNEKVKKRWRARIIGGDIGLTGRFPENKELFENSQYPGPGRYNPRDLFFKYPQHKSNFAGKKLTYNFNKDAGSPANVSPGSYNVALKLGSTVNNFRFSNSPKFMFGTSRRIINRNEDINIGDNNYKYSSFGEQIMTNKDSRPGYSFGKGKRFRKLIGK